MQSYHYILSFLYGQKRLKCRNAFLNLLYTSFRNGASHRILVLLLSNIKNGLVLKVPKYVRLMCRTSIFVPFTCIYHICSISVDIWIWHLIKCMVSFRHNYVEDGAIFCKFFIKQKLYFSRFIQFYFWLVNVSCLFL
jgi:hypothetical protein